MSTDDFDETAPSCSEEDDFFGFNSSECLEVSNEASGTVDNDFENQAANNKENRDRKSSDMPNASMLLVVCSSCITNILYVSRKLSLFLAQGLHAKMQGKLTD